MAQIIQNVKPLPLFNLSDVTPSFFVNLSGHTFLPNALNLLPGVMRCMTRADPNRQNLNKEATNKRV